MPVTICEVQFELPLFKQLLTPRFSRAWRVAFLHMPHAPSPGAFARRNANVYALLLSNTRTSKARVGNACNSPCRSARSRSETSASQIVVPHERLGAVCSRDVLGPRGASVRQFRAIVELVFRSNQKGDLISSDAALWPLYHALPKRSNSPSMLSARIMLLPRWESFLSLNHLRRNDEKHHIVPFVLRARLTLGARDGAPRWAWPSMATCKRATSQLLWHGSTTQAWQQAFFIFPTQSGHQSHDNGTQSAIE